MKCSADSVTLKNCIERDRVYDFLAGKFWINQVRVQILAKEELPSLNETIAIIQVEESRRGVTPESHVVDGSAMFSNGGNNRNPSLEHNQSLRMEEQTYLKIQTMTIEIACGVSIPRSQGTLGNVVGNYMGNLQPQVEIRDTKENVTECI